MEFSACETNTDGSYASAKNQTKLIPCYAPNSPTPQAGDSGGPFSGAFLFLCVFIVESLDL